VIAGTPEAGRLVVHRAEHVRRPADVIGGDHPGGFADVDAADGQVLGLLVVRLALGERGGEDRRVGGHAPDVEVLDQGGQVAGDQAVPADVVEPDRYPGLGELLEHVAHCRSFFRLHVCSGLGV
jgi:hypothetical protein